MRVAEDGTEEPVAPGPGQHVAADVPVLSLQGYIEFAAAEQAIMAVRSRVGDEDLPRAIVLDLDHVTRCHPVAALLFDSIIEQLAGRGVPVVTVDRRGRAMVHVVGRVRHPGRGRGQRPARLSRDGRPPWRPVRRCRSAGRRGPRSRSCSPG